MNNLNTVPKIDAVINGTLGRWLPILVLFIGSVGIALTAFYGESYNYDDLGWHQRFAERLYTTGVLDPPITHIGSPIVLMGLKFILPFVIWRWLSITVMTGCFIVLAVMIYRYLLRDKTSPSNMYRWMVCFVSLLLLIMTPITIFTWSTQNLYLGGYVLPTVYHNPTVNLLKPIAFAQFLIALYFLTSRQIKPIWIASAIGLSIFGLFVKPSYALSMLPALALLTLWRMLKRQAVAWRTILISFGLLSVVILGWQFIVQTTSRSSLTFAPLESIRFFESSDVWIMLKFSLSIAFPCWVLITHWKSAVSSVALVFAWLAFFFSALQFLLMNEAAFPDHGNFWWGAQVCLFILMIVSARFWITQQGELFPVGAKRWSLATIVTMGLFLLHSVSAVFWWGTHVYQTFSHVSWRTWW